MLMKERKVERRVYFMSQFGEEFDNFNNKVF